jgi:hypothetical protein
MQIKLSKTTSKERRKERTGRWIEMDRKQRKEEGGGG